ncbi:hypothetical protein ES705_13244 [subsurface metagenome]
MFIVLKSFFGFSCLHLHKSYCLAPVMLLALPSKAGQGHPVPSVLADPGRRLMAFCQPLESRHFYAYVLFFCAGGASMFFLSIGFKNACVENRRPWILISFFFNHEETADLAVDASFRRAILFFRYGFRNGFYLFYSA